MLLHLMACRCEYNLNVSTWHNFLWYLRPYNSTITYILVFFMYICWSVTIKGLFFCVKFHTWIEIIKAVASQPLMKTASRTAAQQCTHWNHLIDHIFTPGSEFNSKLSCSGRHKKHSKEFRSLQCGIKNR